MSLLILGCGSVAGHAPDASVAAADAGDDAVIDAAADGPSIPADLVAWYTMDTLVHQSVPDATGHSDGTCGRTTCPSLIATGRIGGALAFNGVDQLVRVPSTADLKTANGFTVTVWVNRATGAGNACIVNKGFGAAADNSWQVCVSAAGKLSFYSAAVAGADAQASPQVLDTEHWYHVALWWDGASKTKATYIDGQRTASGTADIAFDDSDITIGGDVDPGTAIVAPLAGEVDDLRIYNRALSDTEIAGLASP